MQTAISSALNSRLRPIIGAALRLVPVLLGLAALSFLLWAVIDSWREGGYCFWPIQAMLSSGIGTTLTITTAVAATGVSLLTRRFNVPAWLVLAADIALVVVYHQVAQTHDHLCGGAVLP